MVNNEFFRTVIERLYVAEEWGKNKSVGEHYQSSISK